MSRKVLNTVSALVLVAVLGVGAAGCADSTKDVADTEAITVAAESGVQSTGENAPNEGVSEVIVIDVRTASEFAEGHLDGAQNLDLNSGQFEGSIQDLDPNAEYVLYCRSGNRANQAASLLEAAGFTKVTNLGSLQDAANATGIDIVQ